MHPGKYSHLPVCWLSDVRVPCGVQSKLQCSSAVLYGQQTRWTSLGPAKWGHIVAATECWHSHVSQLCWLILPCAQHLWWTQILCPGHKKCFWKSLETFLCPCSTQQYYHILPQTGNIARHNISTTLCPHFAWVNTVRRMINMLNFQLLQKIILYRTKNYQQIIGPPKSKNDWYLKCELSSLSTLTKCQHLKICQEKSLLWHSHNHITSGGYIISTFQSQY